MKPIKHNHHSDNFYREMGRKGAQIRWANHTPDPEDGLKRAYEDAKGEWFGQIILKDGLNFHLYRSTNRKDQLDVFRRGMKIMVASPSSVGKELLRV
jgi:hypothetical protein